VSEPESNVPAPPDAAEVALAALLAAKDFDGAADLAVRTYGSELLGFLASLTPSLDDADDVFSTFLEDLWRGLPGFVGASSLRTWAYTLARNALHRWGRDQQRRAHKHVPLSALPDLSALAQQVRTTTLIHLRSEVKDQMAALRDRLEPDDRMLLVLRVSRAMSWRDVAAVLSGEENPPAPELDRRVVALRKQYERVLARLRALAREEGLIQS
jgi:RNA polymerase sigma-70 factor (ECF subfamily)